jgi:hypothetical protein
MGEVKPLKKDKSNKTAKKVSKIVNRKEFLPVVKISFARLERTLFTSFTFPDYYVSEI